MKFAVSNSEIYTFKLCDISNFENWNFKLRNLKFQTFKIKISNFENWSFKLREFEVRKFDTCIPKRRDLQCKTLNVEVENF